MLVCKNGTVKLYSQEYKIERNFVAFSFPFYVCVTICSFIYCLCSLLRCFNINDDIAFHLITENIVLKLE